MKIVKPKNYEAKLWKQMPKYGREAMMMEIQRGIDITASAKDVCEMFCWAETLDESFWQKVHAWECGIMYDEDEEPRRPFPAPSRMYNRYILSVSND